MDFLRDVFLGDPLGGWRRPDSYNAAVKYTRFTLIALGITGTAIIFYSAIHAMAQEQYDSYMRTCLAIYPQKECDLRWQEVQMSR